MANYQIQAEQLTAGQTVLVRGELTYSRLTRLIQGEELTAVNARRQQNGISPISQPHTTVSLTDAEVVFADPNAPTPEEQFVSERRYTSKKHPERGATNYNVDSKGTTLPIIAIPDPDVPGAFKQDTSGRELAAGQPVTLVLRTYKPKNYAKHGLAIDQVVLSAEPRYYVAGGGASPEELAARGITFSTPPQAVDGNTAIGTGDVPAYDDDSAQALPLPGLTAAPAAPAQAAPATPAVTPAAPVQAAPGTDGNDEAKLQALQAELERLRAAQAAPETAAESAVGAPTGPWNGQPQAGISFQG